MSLLDLRIDRPVAGGRMLARHDGVVLVAGALPGERIRAEVERVTRHVTWARVVTVEEASPFRRAVEGDASCGGLDYAHMAYDYQRRLKRDVLVDAFARIGKISLNPDIAVLASPERAYRLRARLHVRDRRAGFFRAGSHTWCDAGPTKQLLPETVPAVDAVLAAIGARADACESATVAENVAATARVVHLEPRPGAVLEDIGQVALPAGVAGITALARGRFELVTGVPVVVDTAADLFGAAPPVDATVAWTRRAASFFQGNRFLIGDLARCVLGLAEGECVLDLYAGVGLFAVALAARGSRVLAVEGDRTSAADLEANAARWSSRLEVSRAAVEDTVARLRPGAFDAVVIDPPRSGLSPRALDGIVGLRAPRLVYVSCDPATLARDAAKILAAGYAIDFVQAFDLFPNTSHIETVARFEKREPRARAQTAPL